MDVSSVVEGTRQYFMGVPAAAVRTWAEPCEPEPHVIHKATVVREALRRQRLPHHTHPPHPPPPPHPHHPRPTVSVTSLVHQMNQTRQRRDSPLDLSVKTVKHSADSTADADVPRPRAAHKVDFAPDFRAQYASPVPAHAARRVAPPAYIVDNRYQPGRPRYTTPAGTPLRHPPPRRRAEPPPALLRYETWCDDSRIPAARRTLIARPVYGYAAHAHHVSFRPPATDRRVLSILRESLETRAPPPRLTATIVIDDDSPPPPPLPQRASRAVDSVGSPEPDAARIRTKAELKGFTSSMLTPCLLKSEPLNIDEIERDAVSAPPPSPPEPRAPAPALTAPALATLPLPLVAPPPLAPPPTATPTSVSSSPSPTFASLEWANTCDSFVQQLQSGCAKKKVRRRRTDPEPLVICDISLDTSQAPDELELVSVKREPESVRLEPSQVKTEPALARLDPTGDESSNNKSTKQTELIKRETESTRCDVEPKHQKLESANKKSESAKGNLESGDQYIESANRTFESVERKTGSVKRELESSQRNFESVKLKTESAKQELQSSEQNPTKLKPVYKQTKWEQINSARRRGAAAPTRAQLQQMEKSLTVDVVDILRMKRERDSSDDDEPLIRSKLRRREPAVAATDDLRPRFGDGSDFAPGWEREVYRYKRALRMPPRLISPWLPERGASSLPDLQPDPVSPASSRAHTAPPDPADSDLDSTSRLCYDSEASSSTATSAVAPSHRGGSILDLLFRKYGRQREPPKLREREPRSPSPRQSRSVPSVREVFGAPASRVRMRRQRAEARQRTEPNRIRDALRSTSAKKSDARGRLLRLRKRNALLERRAAAPPASQPPATRKRLKRLFARRKLSSGFDYIRKKKRGPAAVAKASSAATRPPARRRPTPESVHDIRDELKSWFVNKSVGETLLHRAARLGYSDCVAYCMVECGAEVDARDNAGFTPLHMAAAHGHTHAARLLLQYNADVSAPAHGGIRPLHEACEADAVETARLLLAYGADPQLATYAGLAPTQLAERAGAARTARLLRAHLQDLLGLTAEPWRFPPPYLSLDECLLAPPAASPPPPPRDLELLTSPAPLPPFYTLQHSDALWCQLHDLYALLQVKSREGVVRAAGGAAVVELRTHEFVERARCLALLGAGEKVNTRASRVALVQLTDRLRAALRLAAVRIPHS